MLRQSWIAPGFDLAAGLMLRGSVSDRVSWCSASEMTAGSGGAGREVIKWVTAPTNPMLMRIDTAKIVREFIRLFGAIILD